MGRASGSDERPHGGESQLARLQAHERALAARLAEARSEAERMVVEARTAAARAERELEASLEEEVRLLREASRAELRARLRDITVAAEKRAARFEHVSDERVRELAELGFRQLIGAEDPR